MGINEAAYEALMAFLLINGIYISIRGPTKDDANNLFCTFQATLHFRTASTNSCSVVCSLMQVLRLYGYHYSLLDLQSRVGSQEFLIIYFLLLLYENDISKSSEKLYFILFADDTNIFYQHKDIKHSIMNLRR